MFSGFTQETVDFMWALRFNNEKSWFEAHKDEYKAQLEAPMRELANAVYEGFSSGENAPSLKLHISRIYKDARRLHGSGPYKDHLWFTLRDDGDNWTGKPCFWFELAPENWSYGLGYYCAAASTMTRFRASIDKKPAPLKKLDKLLSSQGEFELQGDDYARPKCSQDSKLFRWYNKKSFSLVHEEEISEDVFSPELPARIISGFSFLLPFYDYLSALDTPTAGSVD